jgi:long-chain acyl-CoA synthetase
VITDRKKDLILVGGFNTYPREVEEVLYEHPAVAVAAVVGVPDARSGEAVKAFVQLKPGESATEEELLAFCKERLAGYKRPRSIEFKEELPVSVKRQAQNHSAGWGSGGQPMHSVRMRASMDRAK